jgi:hypothetical protein
VSPAVLICYGQSPANHAIRTEWTYWPSLEVADQARAELTPCSAACIGIHSVVEVDPEAPLPGHRDVDRFLP